MDALAETLQAGVAADLDRLEERLDRMITLVETLRGERDTLRAERERLCREAGIKDQQGLLGLVARWKALEEEQRRLLREREAVARRVGALLEKVDLLQGGS